MGAITQLAEKCRKCPFVDKCEHKEMEHLAYYEPMTASATVEAGISAEQLDLMETTQINGEVLSIFCKDEIEKEIRKELCDTLMMNYGV